MPLAHFLDLVLGEPTLHRAPEHFGERPLAVGHLVRDLLGALVGHLLELGAELLLPGFEDRRFEALGGFAVQHLLLFGGHQVE